MRYAMERFSPLYSGSDAFEQRIQRLITIQARVPEAFRRSKRCTASEYVGSCRPRWVAIAARATRRGGVLRVEV